jgi:hypothetical protein
MGCFPKNGGHVWRLINQESPLKPRGDSFIHVFCTISVFLVGRNHTAAQAAASMTVTESPASNPKEPPLMSSAHVPFFETDTSGEGEPKIPLTGIPKKFP